MNKFNNSFAICFVIISLLLFIPQFCKAATIFATEDLAGLWENNSLASGPGAPWWLRGPITITSNGSFSGTFEEYNSDPDGVSGSFSISSDGVLSSNDINPDFRAVMDLGKTVIIGTNTWDEEEAGTTEIITLLKKAGSYSLVPLLSGPSTFWHLPVSSDT